MDGGGGGEDRWSETDGYLGKERVMDGDGRTGGGEEVWSLSEQRGE